MNKSVWLVFLVIISVISVTYAEVCYGNACPVGTTRCKKHMKSSYTGYMSITINCLDEEDGSLKTYYFEEPTTLNRNTKYESTSYTDIGGGIRTFPANNRYEWINMRK